MALWDITARANNEPLWKTLGASTRTITIGADGTYTLGVITSTGGGLTVNGSISADGGGGGGVNASGASGGSVNITAGTMAGTGTISANGGGGTTDASRGAGGGGRVAPACVA